MVSIITGGLSYLVEDMHCPSSRQKDEYIAFIDFDEKLIITKYYDDPSVDPDDDSTELYFFGELDEDHVAELYEFAELEDVAIYNC